MVKRLTEMAKTRRAFVRAFAQLGRSVPATARRNWLNVLMPWRILPQPVALSLIGLVALAMVCTDPEPGTWQEPESTPESTPVDVATIGGTDVPADLDCEEDQVIGFVGIPDTLVCIQFDETESDAHGCVTPAFYSEELERCVLAQPLPTSTMEPVPDARCDDDAPPGYTWQGGMEAGYECVPLDQFEGRSGKITTANGTVSYHTAPCGDGETALPPPYADVTLCVDTDAYNAVK